MLSSEKVHVLLMASNCSFRITRTTEDLAQTITALSQRLIKLEQRFEAIELQVNQSQGEMPVKEIEMLDGIDQQLKECKELLETSSIDKEIDKRHLQIESNSDETSAIEFLEDHPNDEDINSIELVEDHSNDEETDPTWIEEETKQDTFAA